MQEPHAIRYRIVSEPRKSDCWKERLKDASAGLVPVLSTIYPIKRLKDAHSLETGYGWKNAAKGSKETIIETVIGDIPLPVSALVIDSQMAPEYKAVISGLLLAIYCLGSCASYLSSRDARKEEQYLRC